MVTCIFFKLIKKSAQYTFQAISPCVVCSVQHYGEWRVQPTVLCILNCNGVIHPSRQSVFPRYSVLDYAV